MKKSGIVIGIAIVCFGVLCGCGESVSGDLSWIPNTESSENWGEHEANVTDMIVGEENDKQNAVEFLETYNLNSYDLEEMSHAILQDDLELFADMAWDNQRMNGLYQPQLDVINGKNVLCFFVSAADGDDANDGLSPNRPKKSLEMFSGVSNVHVYLKTDDVFEMEQTFYVGDNTLIAAYGDGKRPVLDYYQDFTGTWMKVNGYSHVWQMDLSTDAKLYQEQRSMSDCNIGQLRIDGEQNFKRVVGADGDVFNYASYLETVSDGSWGVDWDNGLIYLYSMTDPNQMEIEYSYPGFGVSLSGVSNVWLAGLEITGAGMHGVSLSEVKNVNITNCYIHHIGGAILKKSGMRYGNAIELWDGGENLKIKYNVADWIYDTCYTNQGSSKQALQKNILFSNNVGAHCFQGLEIWGDSYSQHTFESIRYTDNIMLNACDVTAVENSYVVNGKGELLVSPGVVTYRSGNYPYHQMSLLNAGTNRKYDSLQICRNLFVGTDRFLTLFLQGAEEQKYPYLSENVFVESNTGTGKCLYRHSDKLGTIFYCENLPNEIRNEQSVYELDDENFEEGMRKYLRSALELFANETE